MALLPVQARENDRQRYEPVRRIDFLVVHEPAPDQPTVQADLQPRGQDFHPAGLGAVGRFANAAQEPDGPEEASGPGDEAQKPRFAQDGEKRAVGRALALRQVLGVQVVGADVQIIMVADAPQGIVGEHGRARCRQDDA